jgi:hypothetical protein
MGDLRPVEAGALFRLQSGGPPRSWLVYRRHGCMCAGHETRHAVPTTIEVRIDVAG